MEESPALPCPPPWLHGIIYQRLSFLGICHGIYYNRKSIWVRGRQDGEKKILKNVCHEGVKNGKN